MTGTTICSDLVEIDAPPDLVWSVVVDFERYPAWNPYTFRVETTLEVGADVLLHLPHPMTPDKPFTMLEHLQVIDPPHHLQYGTGTDNPRMVAVRDQWVDDLGDGRSAYRTADVFSGPDAQAAFDAMGEWVRAGFNATAHALKARSEDLWARKQVFDSEYTPSTWPPSAEQVALYEATAGGEGNEFMGGPCVVLTTIGARSGTVRKTPVMRVEAAGTYVAIGSMGGAPSNPSWVHNLRADPRCRVQDGASVHELTACEMTGEEKATWWAKATEVWPAYDDYQTSTARVIPLFVLAP
jgi:deazaflavin-dependent oxidoreductase (nitroreductase family)